MANKHILLILLFPLLFSACSTPSDSITAAYWEYGYQLKKARDSGEISELEYQQRNAELLEKLNARAEQKAEKQRQLFSAMNAASNNQAYYTQQDQVYINRQPTQTNCRTVFYGNIASTQCDET